MHRFFTKAQAQIVSYDNLPMLIDVARMYFDKTYCDHQHAEHFFQDYTEHFDDAKDFNLTDKVMLEAIYSDTECWMPSPESMVADYFEGQGVAAEDAVVLAEQFFASLQEQLGDYAVVLIKNKKVREVIIVRGMNAAAELCEAKKRAHVPPEWTPHGFPQTFDWQYWKVDHAAN